MHAHVFIKTILGSQACPQADCGCVPGLKTNKLGLTMRVYIAKHVR